MQSLYNAALDARLKAFASRVLAAYRPLIAGYRDETSLALSWLLAVMEFTELEDRAADVPAVRQRLESREAWCEMLPSECIDLVWADGQENPDLQLKVIREATDAALEYSSTLAAQEAADPLPLVWDLSARSRASLASLHPSLGHLVVRLAEPQTILPVRGPVLCPGDYSGVLPTLLGRQGHSVYIPATSTGVDLRTRLLNRLDKLSGCSWDLDALRLDGSEIAPQQAMRVVGMTTFGAKGWHAAQRLGVPSAFYHEHYTGKAPAEVVAIDYFSRFSDYEATLLVPPLFAFGRGQMAALRSELVEGHKVEAVIQLPVGSFAHTGVAPILLQLAASGTDRIFMADLQGADNLFGNRRGALTIKEPAQLEAELVGRQESDIAKLISYEEVIENDGYLIPARYIHSVDIKNSVALGDLVSIIRSPTPARRGSSVRAEEIGLSQLSYDTWGLIESGGKSVSLDENRLDVARLRQYDVLLSIKGNVGKTGIILDSCDSRPVPYVVANTCVALRVSGADNHDLAIALFMFLRSALGQRQIEALAAGVTMKQITLGTLRSEYQVPRFSAPQIAECRRAFDELQRMESEIEGLVAQQKRIVASLSWDA